MEINILKEQEAATLREMIAASHRIVICCHKSPDGDAIGSSLGWFYYLQSLGKNSTICVPDMIPDAISWLPGTEEIIRYDKHPEAVKQPLLMQIWFSVWISMVPAVLMRWNQFLHLIRVRR